MITSEERQQQYQNLERVTERIGHAILEFFKAPREYYRSDDLYQFVKARVSRIAPPSVNRIACALRAKGLIDFECIHRAGSLYHVVRFAAPDPQQSLFSEEEILEIEESDFHANNN